MNAAHNEKEPAVTSGQSPPRLLGLRQQVERLETYVYSEMRDSNSTHYNQVLQYMLLLTIERNPHIADTQLTTMMFNSYNVPAELIQASLAILRNLTIPDSTTRVLSDRTHPIENKHTKKRHIIHYMCLNRAVTREHLLEVAKHELEMDLSTFDPPVFVPKPSGKGQKCPDSVGA